MVSANHKREENTGVVKKSRIRDDVGESLGGILASLSLLNNGNENNRTHINGSKKNSSRDSIPRLPKQKNHHSMGKNFRGENRLPVVQPIIKQTTPERIKESEETRMETPVESSSCMIPFQSFAASNNKTEGTQKRLMMTPSPYREKEYNFPSSVCIVSSPVHPSPLGESPSPRYFAQFRNERNSPSARYTTTSSTISGYRKETEKEAEEAEETSIEIDIYRPKKNRRRATIRRDDNDEEEESEICSDEEYQPEDTESDTTDENDLSLIVDTNKCDSSRNEYIRSKSNLELNTSYCNPGFADIDTETEEDSSDQELCSLKSKKVQNITFPTASSTLSNSAGGRQHSDFVQVMVLDNNTSTVNDTDEDNTILASIDEYGSEAEYSSDIDHRNTDDDEIKSLYSNEDEYKNSRTLNRTREKHSLSISKDIKKNYASNLSTESCTRRRGKYAVKKGKWTLGSRIGSGSFSVVHVGMNDRTGNLMAVKSLNIPSSSCNEAIKDLQREITVMRSLSHPNIVRYIGAETDTVKHVLHIFQEWVPGGSLSSLLRKFGPFPLPVVRSYLFQIFSGLQYLHSKRILHRDIKGGNVLVNDEGIVKLADFGASKRINLPENGSVRNIEDMMETMTMRGTPYFMAPEVFFGKYGSKADVWSSGGVAYQMCTGKAPWRDLGLNTPMSLLTYLKEHDGPPLMSHTAHICEHKNGSPFACKDLQGLLEKCFRRNPMKRPTVCELLQHSFFTKTDPNESMVDDESVGWSTVTSSQSTCCSIIPMSPAHAFSMKNISADKNLHQSTRRIERGLRSSFDINDWPNWGKQAMIKREDRTKKNSNPFAQK